MTKVDILIVDDAMDWIKSYSNFLHKHPFDYTLDIEQAKKFIDTYSKSDKQFYFVDAIIPESPVPEPYVGAKALINHVKQRDLSIEHFYISTSMWDETERSFARGLGVKCLDKFRLYEELLTIEDEVDRIIKGEES